MVSAALPQQPDPTDAIAAPFASRRVGHVPLSRVMNRARKGLDLRGGEGAALVVEIDVLRARIAVLEQLESVWRADVTMLNAENDELTTRIDNVRAACVPLPSIRP